MSVVRPDWIVVQLTWSPPDAAGVWRSETYGPWVIYEDQHHLEEINHFLDAWRLAHGDWINALMSVVQPPIYPKPRDGVS